MIAIVLSPFLYSKDGISVESLVEGDVRDFDDSVVPGLAQARFIEVEKPADKIETADQPERETKPAFKRGDLSTK